MHSNEAHPEFEIIFPVCNEENRLESGITRTLDYLESIGLHDYVLTIADNNSTDSTPEIAQMLVQSHVPVAYLHIPQKGVGVAVRTAIEKSSANIIGYMDIDLATSLHHLQEVIRSFDDDEALQIVNGSRWANGYLSSGRPLNRIVSSIGLTALLKQRLGMKASDAICGFKFFRRSAALALIEESDQSDDGWFFIIEMLIRAERDGYRIKELPVEWRDDGNSSVKTIPTTKYYLRRSKELQAALSNEWG